MKNISDLFAVILCGGSGSRLWPISRSSRPKQFINFNDDKTLLQKTFQRLLNFYNQENIFIVTNHEFYYEVLGELSDLCHFNKSNIISEPEQKNTLPAICLATKIINDINPNSIISVFSSDHEIENDNEFNSAINHSVKYAANNQIILFGVQPDKANTNYGYIDPGDNICPTGEVKIFNVTEFHEKPSELDAQNFIDKGYLWNSGIFIFKALHFIGLVNQHQPDIHQAFFVDDHQIDKDVYKLLPSVSIDYGLLEKITNIAVLKVDFNWTDLGTWNSLHDFYAKGKEPNQLNNACIGNVIHKGTENSLLWSNSQMILANGIKDMIVINDHDAILVSSKDSIDELKIILKQLEHDHSDLLSDHPYASRPWGSYTVLHKGKNFKIKSIIVKPKQKLSLQLHHHRNEHWVVIKGTATVIRNDELFNLHVNESTYIKANEKHRLVNDTDEILEVIEVSIGENISELDIVRFNDDYGRVG